MVGVVDSALVTLLLALSPSPLRHRCQPTHVPSGNENFERQLSPRLCQMLEVAQGKPRSRQSLLPRANPDVRMVEVEFKDKKTAEAEIAGENVRPTWLKKEVADVGIPPGSKILQLGNDAKYMAFLNDPVSLTFIAPPANKKVDEGPIRKAAEENDIPLTLYADRALNDLPLEKKYYDVALCFDMLAGASEGIIGATLIMFWNALKPGGQLFFFDYKLANLPKLLRDYGFEVDYDVNNNYHAGVATRLDKQRGTGAEMLKILSKPKNGFGKKAAMKKYDKEMREQKEREKFLEEQQQREEALARKQAELAKAPRPPPVAPPPAAPVAASTAPVKPPPPRAAPPPPPRAVSPPPPPRAVSPPPPPPRAVSPPPTPPKPPPAAPKAPAPKAKPPPPAAPKMPAPVAATTAPAAPASSLPPPTKKAAQKTPREKLVVLKNGYDMGLISEEEYNRKKAEVIASM